MTIICREAHLVSTDPDTGVRIFRLTSFPWVSHNIYGEVPYMDSDSRYIMFLRQQAPGRPHELWRTDLESTRLELVDTGLCGLASVAVSPDQRVFYYLRMVDLETVLVKLDIVTLARTELNLGRIAPTHSLGSVTPDKKTFATGTTVEGTAAVMTVDLETGRRDILYSSIHIRNPHVQIDPSDGRHVMVQVNRIDTSLPEELPLHSRSAGIGLALVELGSGRFQELSIGPPHTEVNLQGHQCFIGRTGRVLATMSETGGDPSPEELAERRRRSVEQGNLVSIGPGDDGPVVVARGYRFTHPNASRDGRFFVSDNSDAELVVGSIKTGTCRVLCSTGSSFCSAQYTHPHPYFSPDCRWVVYNSDTTGIPQLYAAELPEGMLDELDG
ncbi:MAG: hypothetical protein ACOCXX_02755 [Planctomycetota bacterium]